MAQGDPGNVLVGIGYVFLAPKDTVNVADTVEEPASPWVYIGYTEDGVDFDATRKEVLHRVDEESNPIFVTITDAETKFVASLAESTFANWKTAFGGGTVTTVAAATGQPGTRTFNFSDEVTELALILQGKSPEGFWRRVYVPKIISVGKIKQEYNRSKKKQLLGIELQAICPVSDIVAKDKTALALA